MDPRTSRRRVRQAAVVDARVGTEIDGRYRVVERIAEGGMGIVYRAERVGLGRPVAIKFLHERVATADVRRRFAVEARAASRMRHPNCVPVIDFGLWDDAPYVVMDFIEGRTLEQILEDEVTVPRALALGMQVLAGLAHAHGHGIVHRDLKPANVLVWSDALGEHAQLADFGVAKILDTPSVGSADLAIGTPSYMSPEQTLGLSVDERSDVYGMGVLLFELLTGRRPFRAPRPFEVMALHREAPVPHFEQIAPQRQVPPQVEGVIRRALAKAPDDRYASAVELAAALTDAATRAHDAVDDEDLDALLVEVGARRRWSRAALVLLIATIGAGAWLVI